MNKKNPNLSVEQKLIMFEEGTELPGSSELNNEKRDGYYKVDPNDKIALYKTINDAQAKIGEFEKPIYVNFDENLCAHSRNKIVGCSKCLEVCPANAIQPNGDTVSIDTAICGGCGMCGSVCPSGAAQVVWPSMDNLLNRLSYISNDYKSIENKKYAAAQISNCISKSRNFTYVLS